MTGRLDYYEKMIWLILLNLNMEKLTVLPTLKLEAATLPKLK